MKMREVEIPWYCESSGVALPIFGIGVGLYQAMCGGRPGGHHTQRVPGDAPTAKYLPL
jgi:hypothetical protein